MARKKPGTNRSNVPDAETLRQLYYVEGKTVREMAQHYHCRTSVLLAAMDAAGIVRRRRGRTRALLPDWDTEKLQQLVKANGIAYVRQFARSHGVNRVKLAVFLGEQPLARGHRNHPSLFDHDQAIRCAYDEGVPVKLLAQHYRCSLRAIGYSLDRTSRKQ